MHHGGGGGCVGVLLYPAVDASPVDELYKQQLLRTAASAPLPTAGPAWHRR
jgi:hypothetical protein